MMGFVGTSGSDDAIPPRNGRTYVFVTLLNLAAWGVVTWQLRDPTRGAFRIELPPTSVLPPTAAPMGTPTAIRLVLHMAGAVRNPGLVRLPEGARVADAVAAAGGFSEAADRVRVNLASPVVDGALLVVPSLAEQVEGAAGLQGASVPPPEAGPMPPEIPGGGQVMLQPEAGLVALQPGLGSGVLPSGPGSANKVNINTASAAELEALPGIGPALAARIVAHRESNGPFREAEDLMAVSGIGQAVLEKIADLVRVQ